MSRVGLANSASTSIIPTSAHRLAFICTLRQISHIFVVVTSKTIACDFVGSRLDYANSILTGISSDNIHCLQRVQNYLVRVCHSSNNEF